MTLRAQVNATPRVGGQANAFVLTPGDFPALVRAQFTRSREAREQMEQTGVRFIGEHLSMMEARPDVFPGITQGVASLGAPSAL